MELSSSFPVRARFFAACLAVGGSCLLSGCEESGSTKVEVPEGQLNPKFQKLQDVKAKKEAPAK